jgi:hypothetical protein
VRRNPLLYSDPNESEDVPQSIVTEIKEQPRESSFFFYLIILANSLLVLFVLGFIWFLFLKSPDLQIKELSNRFFGATPPAETQTTFIAPEIKTEVVITPSQQEKDEIQQIKLKQMREKEELAAERTRIESMKAEIELEKKRAEEAQQAILALKIKEQSINANEQGTKTAPAATAISVGSGVVETEKTLEIEQEVVINAASEPVEKTNSTQSQIDLIMEALKNQQQQSETSN